DRARCRSSRCRAPVSRCGRRAATARSPRWQRRCAACRRRSSPASRRARWCSTCAASTTRRRSPPISPRWRGPPMRWLDRLARTREPDADVATQMAAAFEAANRSDYAAALALWGPLAQAGVARAQNNVGACFAEGLGVARDPALALRWLTLAAEAGDPVGL